MKKEWLIIGATGAVCAAVWGVLLMTVLEPDESEQTEASLSEEEQSLVDFYAHQETEDQSAAEQDESSASEEENQPAAEPDEPSAPEEENQSAEEAEVELEDVPDRLIEKIQDQGLEVKDIEDAAPDQRMSIDDLLAFLEELESLD